MILCRKDRGNKFSCCWNLTLSDTVESRFAMMGEGRKRLETEHRAGALEGVQAAKDGVDKVPVIQAMGKVEKSGLDLLEEFGSFGAEDGNRVKRAHRPSTFRTIFTRVSGSNGLVSQPVAPAAFAWLLRAASDSVVRKMIGTPI